MEVNRRLCITLALALVAAAVPLSMASILPPPTPQCSNGSDDDQDGRVDAADRDCTGPQDNREARGGPRCQDSHSSPHSHTYGSGGSAGARSDTVTGGDEVGAGIVTVSETNTADCDGDGAPGDYDGDWETGVGGGFFGYGPWADEPICNYGLTIHGGTATVSDVVFGGNIAFVIGADDTSGPLVSTDPVTGETTCSTSGSITPGDPATDPTADPDDCLTDVYTGSGATCGAGGDGGYWVFLSGLLVSEGASGTGASNPPTAGTITA